MNFLVLLASKLPFLVSASSLMKLGMAYQPKQQAKWNILPIFALLAQWKLFCQDRT
jgi:hypothetical protein